jgi:glutamate-ammonia-ligase adenylyltransferase
MPTKIELPSIDSYSNAEIEAARSWPAIHRYLNLIARAEGQSANAIVAMKVQRHRAWTACALALFHRRSTDREICSFWSHAADSTIRVAAEMCEFERLGISVFAMGKLGAEELNLSSDIDILFVADDDRSDENFEKHQRAVKSFIQLLSEVDEWGFCHRVDVSIRPGGSRSPLVPTVTQFENHYGYHGEVWERLALTRLRAVGRGKSELATREIGILKFAQSISFRKHLDYSVLEEIRILLSRIRAEHRPHPGGTLHLKLEAGCIRDLELFVHALICIHGGRRAELRMRRTDDAISALAHAELITEAEKEFLCDTYWTYRGIENRIQAFQDEQTYNVSELGSVRIIHSLAERVKTLSESRFPSLKTTEIPSVEDLIQAGFATESTAAALDELQSAKALSRKSERDERERTLFLSDFLQGLAKSPGDKNLGLGLLVDFVKATRAKATFFSLLNREPALLRQMVRLFSESPWAGSILSSRPELLDSLLLRQDHDLLKLQQEFDRTGDLAMALENLSERRLTGELVAILHFLETRNLEACTENLTNLADQIAANLMQLSAKEIGCEPLDIIALGKWGGKELGVRSDLDFVFFTPHAPNIEQHRLARRFLNRMTEAHRGGSLYAVDIRLRPSGHAGPLLVHHDSLIHHMREEAQAWERQSWLRARFVSGPKFNTSPSKALEELTSINLNRGLTAADEAQLSEIARQLFKPLPSRQKRTLVDLKLTNGGLAPIDFAAQIAILRDGKHFASTIGTNSPSGLETSTRSMVQFLEEHAVSHHQDWKQHGPRLRDIHGWLRSLEQAARITGDSTGSVLHLESNEFARLAQFFSYELESRKPAQLASEALTNYLLTTLAESAESLRKLGR